ncbi:hypothetical protein [Heliorestis convoluta]|uniref:Uncharacterized protein n=1 Tax=Heliorestis convoluta TaxID=356322 RepID=A0A5Q2N776_9FIRM|nr:hypothetical protein [Heliorestis convoluta]QGG48395.1 hypothetical protein FTV88_2297 [Heliorestis convoluta]
MKNLLFFLVFLHIFLYYVLFFFFPETHHLLEVFLLPSLFLVGLLGLRWARNLKDPTRNSWIVLSLATFVYIIGDILWFYYDYSGLESGKASGADLLYYICAFFLVIGISGLLKASISKFSFRCIYLDIWTLMIIIASVVSQFLLYPLWTQSDLDVLSRLALLFYPLLDLLIIFFALLIAYRWPRQERAKAYWLIAGIFFWVVVDSYYLLEGIQQTYEAGNFFAPFWGFGFFCFFFALQQHVADEEKKSQ